MRALSTVLILFAGVINLLPVRGVVSEAQLQSLYRVAFDGAERLILMRHRAVLFAIVGSLLVVSAFHEPYRSVAIAAGLVSMLSFVALARLVGVRSAEIRRIEVADLLASAALVAAAILDFVTAGPVSAG